MKAKVFFTLPALLALQSAVTAQFSDFVIKEPGLGNFARLGDSVFLHQERAVVGATNHESAHVYEYDPGSDSWILLDSLAEPSFSSNSDFGHVVGLHGGRAVVGAPGSAQSGTSSAGAAWVFEPTTSSPDTYSVSAILYASDAESGAEFGYAAAIRGDWAIVGAPEKDKGSVLDDRGAVYLYERRSGAPYWGPTQDLKIVRISGLAGERFGYDVDMSGSRAVIGAPLGGSNFSGTGSAFVYANTFGSWSEEDELDPGEEAGRFGAAVAIYADLAVVGAPGYDDTSLGGPPNVGRVYVFERQAMGGSWSLVAKIDPPEGESNLQFGLDVEVWDDRLVVGSWLQDAYLFSRGDLGSGEEWFYSGKLKSDEPAVIDEYGAQVAMSGDFFAVGAPRGEASASTSEGGRAYMYHYPDEFAALCFASEGDCPCGNDNASGGCLNSTGEGGYLASLGSGSLAAHDLGLRGRNLPIGVPAVLFSGSNAIRTPFRDGLLCTAGNVQRLATRFVNQGGFVNFDPTITIDVLAPSAGDVAYYQVWHRDAGGPCGNGSNTTSAVRVEFEL